MKRAFHIFLAACFAVALVTYFASMSSYSWGNWYNFRNPVDGMADPDPEAPQPISHTFGHGCINGMSSVITGAISLMDDENKVYEVRSPNPRTYLIGFAIGFFAFFCIPYGFVKWVMHVSKHGRGDSDDDDSDGMSIANPANPLSPFNPINQIR